MPIVQAFKYRSSSLPVSFNVKNVLKQFEHNVAQNVLMINESFVDVAAPVPCRTPLSLHVPARSPPPHW